MKRNILFTCLLCLISCGKKESKVTVQEVGPRISEGYYAINNPDQYQLPLVAVKNNKGNMVSYGFLNFQCAEQTYQSYAYAGITFSDRPVSVAGRSVKLLSSDCEIKTEIIAESDTSIRVKVFFNQKEVDSYSLVQVSKDDFVQSLKTFSDADSNFQIEEKTCLNSFDSSCESLNLRTK